MDEDDEIEEVPVPGESWGPGHAYPQQFSKFEKLMNRPKRLETVLTVLTIFLAFLGIRLSILGIFLVILGQSLRAPRRTRSWRQPTRRRGSPRKACKKACCQRRRRPWGLCPPVVPGGSGLCHRPRLAPTLCGKGAP